MFVYNLEKRMNEEIFTTRGEEFMEENFFKKYDIWAFIPEYSAGIGESTRVLLAKGKDRLMPISVKTLKTNLCKYYSIDYKSSRKKYGKTIGCVNCVPLPVTIDKVFIQLKVREPRFKGDIAMGYIDLNCIKTCNSKKDKKASDLVLKDGRKLGVLYSVPTIKKHMKNGKIIMEHYKRERGYIVYPESLESFYSGFEKPATKADIAILVREIATLKNTLKVF